MAMYQSLGRYCNNFHLYIFAFDQACYDFFYRNSFANITVVSLAEFEDEELLRVKSSRTKGEYCWTCTSSTILYVLNHFKVDHCTYIDADLYFFSSPQVLIDEMGDASILLTEHRYTKEYDQTATSGRYCVQFMLFRNDDKGCAALKWWRNKCLNWCYNRMEDGKFGDQKYLDDWISRFEGVHVLKYLGGGVAPWNMQQYTFKNESGIIIGHEIASGEKFHLVFFHFHALQFITSNHFSPLAFYTMPCRATFKEVFKPYILNIKEIRKKFPLIMGCEQFYNYKHIIRYIISSVYHKHVKQELYYYKCVN